MQDRAQLERLFHDRFDPMVRLATLLVGDVHTAEDLVMDAFSRVGTKLSDVEHPKAYLRTAVVNAARSAGRREVTERTRATLIAVDVATHDPAVDQLWDRLSELRPDERACVVLRFYEDLTVPQVAEQMGMPEGTVKSHLHRAIAKLRDLLGDPTTDGKDPR